MELFIGCPYCGDKWMKDGDTVTSGGDLGRHMPRCEFNPNRAPEQQNSDNKKSTEVVEFIRGLGRHLRSKDKWEEDGYYHVTLPKAVWEYIIEDPYIQQLRNGDRVIAYGIRFTAGNPNKKEAKPICDHPSGHEFCRWCGWRSELHPFSEEAVDTQV